MKRFINTLFLCLCLLTSGMLMGQSYPCSFFESPFLAPSYTTSLQTGDPDGWYTYTVDGDLGDRYFKIYTNPGDIIVLTTLPELGGILWGFTDSKITIIDDVTNKIDSGRFNLAHNDDYRTGVLRSMLAWSPAAGKAGWKKVYVTEYPCNELAPGRKATVAVRVLRNTIGKKYAFFTHNKNGEMNDPANWYVFGDQITPDVSRNGLAGGDYNVHVETNIAAFHNMNATCKNFYVSKKSHVLFEGNTCQLTVKEDLTIAAYQAPYSYWVESGSIDSNSEFNKLTVAREAIVNGGFYNMNLVLGKQSSTYTGVLNQTMSGIFIPRPSIRTLEVAPLKEKASIKCPIRVYNQIDLKNGSLIFEDNGSLHISATLPILNYRHVRYIALQDGCSIEVFFNGYESTTLPIAKILPVNGSSVVAYRPIDFRIDNASPSGSSFWQFGLETGYDASRQQESFASPLQRISHVDLWTVKKTSGPSNMKYTASLHWGATSGVNLQALSSLKLAGKTQATGTWQAVGTNITSSTGIYGSGSTHGKVISESVEYLSLGATNTSHALGNQSSPRIGTRDIAERLHAFPNPAVEKVTIKIPNLDEAAELSIISITGKELRSQTVEPGIDKLNIPRLGLTSGTYILRLSTGGKRYVTRVVFK